MIELNHVTHYYTAQSAEGIRALRDISLSIKEGEFVIVLGHNGSGKSTFAKLLNGLIVPSKGEVLIDGISTASDSRIWEIRSRVGMVFQNPDSQLIATTVEEEVAFGLENIGVPREEMLLRIEKALAMVGLEKKRNQAPHLLSGGQKQKLAIASVLAMHPRYLVLDEPTAMLDPVGQQEVLETVRELNASEGITIVLVTQNMNEVSYAGRALIMKAGSVEMDGLPGKLFSQIERITALSLEPPPMTLLAHRLRKAGFSLSSEILTIEGMAQALKTLVSRA